MTRQRYPSNNGVWSRMIAVFTTAMILGILSSTAYATDCWIEKIQSTKITCMESPRTTPRKPVEYSLSEKTNADVKAALAKFKPGDVIEWTGSAAADGNWTVTEVSIKSIQGRAGWALLSGVVVAIVLLFLISHPFTKADSTTTDEKPGGMFSLLVGADNRLSNSKCQAVVWMVALLIAYIGTATIRWSAGMEWGAATTLIIPDTLLALAAISVGTAGGAKIATATKVANAATPETAKPPAPAPRLKDLVSDDTGAWDSSDAQMVVVTVASLIMFGVAVYTLWTDLALTASGTLPEPSNVMTAAFGGSLAGYLANKVGFKLG